VSKGRIGLELGACFDEIVDRIETTSETSLESTTKALVMIIWQNVITVLSAAVLIGAEVFGAAFAGGWAIASLLGLGDIGIYVAQSVLFVCGIAVMISFVRNAMEVEPFRERA
jgi:2-methylisocitrate lyase-like PEP mutase family enzyme